MTTVEGVLAALADPTRRSVLESLVRDGATTATVLARRLPVTRQAVGKHLSVLERAGLVHCQRVGREARYRPASAQEAPPGPPAGALDPVEVRFERRRRHHSHSRSLGLTRM